MTNNDLSGDLNIGCFNGAKADWIQTFTGRAFAPLAPAPEDICIEDIAHALANVCRYGGHTLAFYSVAQHSVMVSRIVPPELALWGLLHDAAEAYLGDLPRPLKRQSGYGELYRQAEDRLLAVIAAKFGLPWPEPPEVKEADNIILATEKRDLMAPAPMPWGGLPEPLIDYIIPWQPSLAERCFLDRWFALRLGVQAL